MKIKKIVTALILIIFPVFIGLMSAKFIPNTKETYDFLIKPFLSPPAYIFPIMWTLLYFMMGFASWLIYNSEKDEILKKKALIFYGAQLFFNCFWSLFFFGLNLRLLSFIWLFVLWILIIMTMKYFKKISMVSFYLLVPYLLWVTFAGYLNLGFYFLNR